MCCLRQTFLLLLLLIGSSYGLVFEKFNTTNFFQHTSAIENRLSDCLITILSDRNLPFKPVIQIYVDVKSASVRHEFVNTIESFFSKCEEFSLKLSIGQLSTSNHQKYNCWLFFIDSIKSLENLRDMVQRQQALNEKNIPLSAKDEYFLIMIPKDTPYLMKFLRQIFEFYWSKPILNVNVLIEDASADGVITVYTYYPFTKTICRNFLPTIQNRFINGKFEKNESVFLSKTSNFWQCPISVILWEEEIFIREEQRSLHGADYLYLGLLAQMLNSSLKFVVSPHPGGGDVYENKSFDKAFKSLNDKHGDLMLGLWCTRERQLNFEGVPYSFDNELIIFKIPEAHVYLDILMFPFDNYTWFILLLLCIGKWISKQLLKHISKKNRHCRHRQNSEIIFMGSWLFGTFILKTSYEGLIFKFLHNKPFKVLPNSLDEALEHNYKFIVPNNGLSLYSQIQGLNDSLISDNENEYFETFNKLGEKYALISSEKYISAYKIKIEDYFTAKKPLIKTMDCFYVPKYSFLTKKLQKLLQLLDERGIRKKIISDFKTKKNVFKKNVQRTEKFSLQNVRGTMEMLIILIVVSGLMFFIELLSRHNRYLNMIMNWIHY